MVASLEQTVRNTTTGTGELNKQTFTLDASNRISTTKTYTDSVRDCPKSGVTDLA